VDQQQLAAAADHGEEAEDVRQLNAREIALEDVILSHVGPAATVPNKPRRGKGYSVLPSSTANAARDDVAEEQQRFLDLSYR
jgi:hypothetical protein